MSRLGILFSGQGAQHPAMLGWLRPCALQRRMCDLLRVQEWRIAVNDPAWAMCNRHSQLLLTGVGLAAWKQLAPLMPEPVVIAGYSVGELAACSAAGLFDGMVALELAEARAALMDQASARTPGGLMSVTGLTVPRIDALIAGSGLEIAIAPGVDVAVVGGPVAALTAVEGLARRLGARCTRLRVSVASHTSWMRSAAIGFAGVLGDCPMAPPRSTLLSGNGAWIRNAGDARSALSRQICETVQWARCMEAIGERRVDCVLEIGPGSALARLWNQRFPEIPARSADEFHRLESVAEWIAAQVAA